VREHPADLPLERRALAREQSVLLGLCAGKLQPQVSQVMSREVKPRGRTEASCHSGTARKTFEHSSWQFADECLGLIQQPPMAVNHRLRRQLRRPGNQCVDSLD